jgi:hypothetical protein
LGVGAARTHQCLLILHFGAVIEVDSFTIKKKKSSHAPSLKKRDKKEKWILLKAFSASVEMIKWFLSLLLLMCCITFIDLHMLNQPCIPGM